MSTTKESESKACSCWIPVVATILILFSVFDSGFAIVMGSFAEVLMELSHRVYQHCLLYTSPSPRDRTRSRMPSSA